MLRRLTRFGHRDDLDDTNSSMGLQSPVRDAPELLDEVLADVLDHLYADEPVESASPLRFGTALSEVHVMHMDAVGEARLSDALYREVPLLACKRHRVDGTVADGSSDQDREGSPARSCKTNTVETPP